MFKLIGHAVVFVVGAGVGVYWGVHHPVQAANLSDIESTKIQAAVAQAKQTLLQQVVAEQNSTPAAPGQPDAGTAAHLSKYQQWLNTAQQEFNAAQSKLNGQ